MASAESIRARTRISNLLSPSSSPPFASPPPPQPQPQPHPPFTNGSMPMSLLAGPLDPPTANGDAEITVNVFGSGDGDEDDEDDEAAINTSSLKCEPSGPLAVDDSPIWGPPDLTYSPPIPTHTPTGTRLRGTPTPPRSSPIYAPSSPLLLFPNIETPPTRHETDSIAPRYDDGEVVRYGAGESYRPFNSGSSNTRDRSPRRGPEPTER
ncbi:hypothetical protein INS49_011611 [Diaporthe citri]|uniref:uncharacterized protein n=1 Tax=Diaporthe citri TaxID=83186 RepID=UPI001C80658B|nr:uncharacterized protein INS49_011611 [Diaporthe citri]KAG6360549.1 hypothetical protein INS49_011611 [Diaporthe citri]